MAKTKPTVVGPNATNRERAQVFSNRAMRDWNRLVELLSVVGMTDTAWEQVLSLVSSIEAMKFTEGYCAALADEEEDGG